MTHADESNARRFMRYAMALAYFGAGVGHIVAPDLLLPITPAWVPQPRLVIVVTGFCEIAGALALLTTRLRWWAGIMLALYAVCVFPANIKHALEDIPLAGLDLGWWYHIPRLLAQPVIVWWALYCAKVIDWPFGSAKRER